ncbi:MAG: nitroreductase family protein [Azoarcus sp.]|nr:nitroreductase family protein [Azoarcus sp.]
MSTREILLKILDLARWAPSGDNTQPWRFEVLSDTQVAVHGHDTRDWCVYDFEGRASYMAHGALLETIRVAASRYRLKADWALRESGVSGAVVYEVSFEQDPLMDPDPLSHFIESRTVQRRPMRTTPLTATQRAVLFAAPGSGYGVRSFESFRERLAVARLLWRNAHVRLTCPEAYLVHKEVIEWNAQFSEDRIPEQAVGVDPLTARLMQWAMQSWERVSFLNRYLLGTLAPRIQLDLIPALSCAGHLLIVADAAPTSVTDFARAGGAMQRLWLTAASLGLHVQPEMTPLIFGWYAEAGKALSADDAVSERARALGNEVLSLAGAGAVFFCRTGYSRQPLSRSIRKPLSDLMV